jgi:hypothetical protein
MPNGLRNSSRLAKKRHKRPDKKILPTESFIKGIMIINIHAKRELYLKVNINPPKIACKRRRSIYCG